MSDTNFLGRDLSKFSDKDISDIKEELVMVSNTHPEMEREKILDVLMCSRMLEAAVRGKGVITVKTVFGEASENVSSIYVIGEEMCFDNVKLFKMLGSKISNLEVIPKTDNKIDLVFTFHGMCCK